MAPPFSTVRTSLQSSYRCAFRLLGNAADAEDPVQEALLDTKFTEKFCDRRQSPIIFIFGDGLRFNRGETDAKFWRDLHRLRHNVLVQPEMEKRRSPLVSIPPFGRGFSRDGGLSIPMELGGARTSPRAPFIVSMSPPDYPSAWLRPRSARFRFARQVHCSSATTCRFSTCSWPVIPPDVIALDYNSYLP
jgi:hypothetical protein